MNPRTVNRLVLPGAMATALLLSLAYWWLENLVHELFGTVLFTLLVWHIFINRLWFKNLLVGRYDALRVASVVLHFALIANVAVLLATSVAISQSVFAPLPIPDIILLRDVHWFAAYWLMIIVGIHVGLHWRRVMAVTRTNTGLAPSSSWRSWLLRAGVAAIAAFGLWSWSVLGVWEKLTFTYSLQFWDFTTAVSPFFGHLAGVVAIPIIATHYLVRAYRFRR